MRCSVISSGATGGRSITCTRRTTQPPESCSPHCGHCAAAWVCQWVARSMRRRPAFCSGARFVRLFGSRSGVAGLTSGGGEAARPRDTPRSRTFSCWRVATCCRRRRFCSCKLFASVRRSASSRSRSASRSWSCAMTAFCRASPSCSRRTSCSNSPRRTRSCSSRIRSVVALNEPRGRRSSMVRSSYSSARLPSVSSPTL
jgi:hypothetical protein